MDLFWGTRFLDLILEWYVGKVCSFVCLWLGDLVCSPKHMKKLHPYHSCLDKINCYFFQRFGREFCSAVTQNDWVNLWDEYLNQTSMRVLCRKSWIYVLRQKHYVLCQETHVNVLCKIIFISFEQAEWCVKLRL